MLTFSPFRLFKFGHLIVACWLKNSLQGNPTVFPLLPGSVPGIWQPAPSVKFSALYWSPAVFSLWRREYHTPHPEEIYQQVPHSFEKTALHFLPVAPLPYIVILSQGWAVRQTPQDPFLLPHLPYSLCRPRGQGGCSQPGSEFQFRLN